MISRREPFVVSAGSAPARTDLILGISAFYHDSAAALVADGAPIAAAHEERFSRRRHDPSFPGGAIAACLDHLGVTLDDVSTVAYYEDSRLKLRRVLASYAAAGRGAAPSFGETMYDWLSYKPRIEGRLARHLAELDLGRVPRVLCRRHHESHAASAFLPSPYESAAILCVDGVGEWATTTLWHGQGTTLRPLSEIRFPHSLGFLYSAFTYFCGFKVDSGEYKLMGLAPYGKPVYADLIRRELIDVKPDGSFRLNVDRFDFLFGKEMTGAAFEQLFGLERRRPEGPLHDHHFDLAASVQEVTEDVMLRLARTAHSMTGERFLCLAGGVALNCVANGRLLREGVFEDIWIQPAAGDAGGALGAAMATAVDAGAARAHLGRGEDAMAGSLLGGSYAEEEIRDILELEGAAYARVEEDELLGAVARKLAEGSVVGWFQGRMEYGPRALGARSILGDPRDPGMQRRMNMKIKFRESFRPFAPAVLLEHAAEYFDLDRPSPYMLLVAEVAEAERVDTAARDGATGMDLLNVPRSTIPAVTHVDFSARVQTVSERENRPFHRLLSAFHEITGCPVLINTSFNVRGEPIVNTPRDAYTCFMRTGIDVLAIGPFVLEKVEQPAWREEADWRAEIPLD
ncbi:MAG TPA: carbamoyltransferase N-terminal domain-containing protein [Solirubrobacteraceae bacterium]|nr:carbamoyltransferase N-terminal domain-containing protein [Solirubrobacteraceae bacterium]